MKTVVAVAFALSALIFAHSSFAAAQQTKQLPRIGYLSAANSKATRYRQEAFLQGLHELGYIEEATIKIDFRYANENPDRLKALAAEIIQFNPNIVVVENNVVARAASALTKSIPIVILSGSDPVASGLVASLAHPGGNITGLTNFALDLGLKRLELLKEIVPGLTRVAVLPSPGGDGQALTELQKGSPSLQIDLHVMHVGGAEDFEAAFIQAAYARVGALIVTTDPTGIFLANQERIVTLAAKKRLPTIYPGRRFVEKGGLLSYAASDFENLRRASTYVDKILKGAKPGDLPIEQPTKFELVINLTTAKQIGLIIPPNVLARADRVIR